MSFRKLVILMLLFRATQMHSQAQSFDINNLKSYNALYADQPILIDGRVDPIWAKANWSDDFVDISSQEKPRYQTNMKIMWDSTNLYFLGKMEEPHIWADIKNHDEVIFHNNDFEIFIDPEGDTHHYIEFEMNALNTTWDLIITKPYRNRPYIIDNWDIKNLQTATRIVGTLNNPSDRDSCWYVEIAMPWVSLDELYKGKTPPAKKQWRINFSRVNWDYQLVNGQYEKQKDHNGKALPEYNWVWSAQGEINMHAPERWGIVRFLYENIEKNLEADEIIKQQLYDLYKLRYQWKDDHSVNLEPLIINNQPVQPNLEFHISGWNLWTISPFSGKTLIIKEDGEFIEKD